MRVLVLTADQRGSRRDVDRVPAALAALAQVSVLRGFERTAGDEIQGVLVEPAALPAAIEALLREGGWRIGIGAGVVEEPLAASTRAGRGPAYLRARDALEAARTSPCQLRVAGPAAGGGPHDPARSLESALWLWAALLARRTVGGWEVSDLLDDGLSYAEAGSRLGITQSAVSQRAQAAAIAEGRRARELVAHLAGVLLTEPEPEQPEEPAHGA